MTKGGETSDLPVMIWDGDCRFCAKWIERWKKRTGDRVRYVPYQDFEIDEKGCLKQFASLSVDDCKRAVQLVMPDGRHYKGAEAVFRALDYAGSRKRWLWFYESLPGFKFFSELLYRFVARHRSWF